MKDLNRTVSMSLLLLAGASLLGCGTQNSRATPADNVLAAPQSISGTAQIPAAALNALDGAYFGRMTKVDPITRESLGSQDYTFTLSQTVLNGVQYSYLQFRSSGPIGDVNFDAPLAPTLSNFVTGTSMTYSFVSGPGSLPVLTQDQVAVELILTLVNGKFYPAQSMISILDCGFYQASCSNPLQDVQFASDLVKR